MKYLSLLILLLSTNLYAVNCPGLWGNGFPDRGRERVAFECTRFSGNSNYELYFSNNLSMDSSSELLSVADEAITRSYSVYGRLGAMPRVKAVVYHNPSFKDPETGGTTYAEAFLDWYRTSEACPVIIYPAALSFSTDYFKQLLAHELFHCFQELNFQRQSDNGTQNGVGVWWLEGLAQYFSNVVYPRIDLEYSPMFDAYRPLDTFFNQAYGNVHFFQSLANQSSNEELIRFMGQMPAGASPSQQSALAGISGIEVKLHKFAQEIVSATLRDSSGREAPLAPLDPQATYEVPASNDTWRREIPVSPFTISYFKIHLPEKARLTFRLENAEHSKVSIKHQDESEWRNLPTEVETPCDLDETYDLVITNTHPSSALESIVLVIDQEEKQDCPCNVDSRPRDECLYGTWDVDMSTVRAFYERMMNGAGGVTIQEFTGAMEVTFNRDGTGQLTNSNWKVRMEMDSGRNIITMINEIWGSTTWRYTTQGRGNICSQEVTNNLDGKATVIIDGNTMSVPMDRRVFSGASIGQLFTYECSGNQLLYKEAIGAGPGGTNLQMNYLFYRR